MKAQERSVGIFILLSLITCGIYSIYWLYAMTTEVNDYLGDNDTSGGMVLLFTFITCGIYAFYWYYKMGKRLAACQEKAGIKVSDDSVLYLILVICGCFVPGLPLVASAIMQSNANKVWTA